MFNIFGGDVPTKKEMEENIDNERAYGEYNPTGNEVLISEVRRYGPIEDPENPCEDGNKTPTDQEAFANWGELANVDNKE